MVEQHGKTLVPQIRFAGFTDPWEQRKLGELSNEFKSGEFICADNVSVSGSYPVYGGNGLRGYTTTFNHEGLYTLIGRQGALCGNVNIADGKSYFTEHAVAVKANHLNDTTFLYYLFGTLDLGQYSGQSAQPGLAVSNLVEVEAMVPDKAEQKKISRVFKTVDSLITLHQRKYDKLCVLKKSMLDKMFPKGGSLYPEIRFSGFTDPWEQRKLGEELGFLRNNTLSRAELSDSEGTVFDIHYGDVLIKYGSVLDAEKADVPRIANDAVANRQTCDCLQDGDVIIADTAEDSAVGKCTELCNSAGKKVFSGLHTMPLRPMRKYASGYLGHYLNSPAFHDQLLPLMQGIKVISVSRSAIEDMTMSVPSVAEQASIGAFFDRLDSLITLHQRKLELLRNIKKSMLDKMFV